MKHVDRLILSAIILGLLVNIASAFFSQQYPQASLYAAALMLAAVVLWGLFRLALLALQFTRAGRYAVLVFYLNVDSDLLLVKHPFHGRLIPPGGRLHRWEIPHVAVARVLNEEAAITQFEFHPKFHKPDMMLSDVVEEVPRPFAVQIEHRRQRGLVRFHYAFVYVCRPIGTDSQLEAVQGYAPRWMNLTQMYLAGHDMRPFDDVLLRYQDLLRVVRPDLDSAKLRAMRGEEDA